jgi:cell division transport system permease protein
VIRNWALRHLQVFFYTLGQLARTPFATLMTVAVIAVALAMPTGLYLLVGNVKRVSDSWDGAAHISVFLKKNVSESRAEALARKYRKRRTVATVDYLSPDKALDEFRRLSGLGGAISELRNNPLPGVLIVRPKTSASVDAPLQNLLSDLKAESAVDLVQLDLQWVQRLHTMLTIARRVASLLGILLSAAVLLIVGNTIRLAVLSRREEIEVIKLIGGTDAFIRRPFLYSGALQGLLGALGALLLIQAGLWTLDGPIGDLARLYGSDFSLQGPGWTNGTLILGIGLLLGWAGSRIAVGRHLGDIAPR